MGSFVQKDWSAVVWPCLQWTADEKYMARLGGPGVQWFESRVLNTGAESSLAAKGATHFSVSPATDKYRCAVFVPKSASKPGVVSMYEYPRFKREQVVAAKSIFTAEEARIEWSANGKVLLALLSSAMSADSYYGDSACVLLGVDGTSNLITLPKDGPVHDIAWNPAAPECCVIAGGSPPVAALFNTKGKLVHNMGPGSRNTCVWSPSGQFFMLGGFGNMAGGLEFWDRKELKKFCDNEAACTTHCM